MVTIPNADLNQMGVFAVAYLVDNLGLANPQSSERLAKTWYYCEQHYNNNELLWRGIKIVEILSMFCMDHDSLCAALIFPLVDAGIIEERILEIEFSKNIFQLVHGVRDIHTIYQLHINHNNLLVPAQIEIDHVRRMLLARVKDFRCLFIKLAERIVNLRELKNAPEDEQVLAANESINIYVPLSKRLGIGQITWELEDFCFRYLHLNEYKCIAKLLHERRIDREKYIKYFVSSLRHTINEKGLQAEIYGRPKNIYSIWRKMQKKALKFDKLFDILAVRVVVDCVQDCYVTLGIVHTKFFYLPEAFDDYIANPKPNGYQSIHTVVLGPLRKTLEIQIRTRQMHKDAELGVAAHWKYKAYGTDSGSAAAYSRRSSSYPSLLHKLLA